MTLKKSRCFDGHDNFPFMVSLSIYPFWTNALHHVLNSTHHILIKLATRQKVKVKTDNPFSCCVTECVHGIPWKFNTSDRTSKTVDVTLRNHIKHCNNQISVLLGNISNK